MGFLIDCQYITIQDNAKKNPKQKQSLTCFQKTHQGNIGGSMSAWLHDGFAK